MWKPMDVKTAAVFLVTEVLEKDAREENTKTNYGLDTMGEKEKRTSKINVDGRSTSSHDNKKFRTRSMEKQRGMALGFRKTATAVKKPGQTDRTFGKAFSSGELNVPPMNDIQGTSVSIPCTS
jgi:hypothetical protein